MARPQLTALEIDDFRESACIEALNIIMESGLESLTFRELGKRLGCSYAKPHRYFGDKDRLIDAVRAVAFDRLAAFISGDDPDSADIPLIRRYLSFAASQGTAFEILFGFRQPYVSADTRAAEDRAWKVCTEPFYEAVEKGELKGDPEKIAHLVWVTLHGLSALTLSGQMTHGMTEDEVIIELQRLLFKP